ncbi:hypothetical protein PWT90_05516 [Aphanocladium album]|nr:hypothetical protein PWT90_05516 [Aphanocladium album]
MGNGAKAQQKRERNAKDKAGAAKSQLKVVSTFMQRSKFSLEWPGMPTLTSCAQNAAACDIICTVCRSTFLKTTKPPQLLEHAQNKHNKGMADCFPSVAA